MAAISSIAIAVVAAGTVASVMGTMQEAKAQSDALTRNAQLADRQALVSRQQAAHDKARQDKIGRLHIGAIRAGYGASGTTQNEDILAMSITNAKMDELAIEYQGELRARGYQDEAAQDRYASSTAIRQGTYRSASALLGGVGKMATIGALSGGGSSSPSNGDGGLRGGGEFGTTRNSDGALMDY